MLEPLVNGLHHRFGPVRKACVFALTGPRAWARMKARPEDYRELPPVLANSFPKSGTHLLDQIATGLPERVNYGAFLSSMTSSFQMRLRSVPNTLRFINRSTPGEIVRAHLFYHPKYDVKLEELNFVHYFIYRDPRDTVVSASHFLRYMNRWHRMSGRFRSLPSDEEGVLLATLGLPKGEAPDHFFPDVQKRFEAYAGWLDCPHVYAVRYEDLVNDSSREKKLGEMIDFYAARTHQQIDREATLQRILTEISPKKSHTYRAKKGNWRDAFTPRVTEAFKSVAGDLLIRLGYERDNNW
jgi:hypothetical protein